MDNNRIIAKSILEIWGLPKDYIEGAEEEPTDTYQRVPISAEDLEKEWDRRHDEFPRGETWAEGAENPNSPDCLAWYSPYVFYGEKGGIYITAKGLRRVAAQIYRELSKVDKTNHAAQLSLRFAWEFLFKHELYHHMTEMFSLSYDMNTGQTGTYENWFRNLKNPTNSFRASQEPLDEALADAYGYRSLKNKQIFKDLPKQSWYAVSDSLLQMFASSPSGYKEASRFTSEKAFLEGQRELIGRMLQKTAPAAQTINSDVAFGLRFSLKRLSNSDARIVERNELPYIDIAAIIQMTQEWGGNAIINLSYVKTRPSQ